MHTVQNTLYIMTPHAHTMNPMQTYTKQRINMWEGYPGMKARYLAAPPAHDIVVDHDGDA